MASIQHRPERKLPWRVIWREPGTAKQVSKSFATHDAARAHKASVEVEVSTGAYIAVDSGAVTVEAWAAHCTTEVWHVRPSTAARTTHTLAHQILPAFGHMRIDAVTHPDVQAWVTNLGAEGYAPATTRKAWQTLSKLFGTAITHGLVRANPCTGVTLPEVPHHDARFLDPDQVHALADVMDDRYRAVVYLGAVAGLRAGELFGLCWRDVDVAAGHVDVRQSVKEYDGGFSVGAPKTKRSRRRVPMPSVLANEMAAHRRRVVAAGGDVTADAHVFTAPDGGMMRPGNFRNRMWRHATAAVGLDGLVIHELRHTAVALWIAAGATPNEVAARAGHTSVSVVLDRYGHLFPANSQRVNDAIDAMFTPTNATVRNINDARGGAGT